MGDFAVTETEIQPFAAIHRAQVRFGAPGVGCCPQPAQECRYAVSAIPNDRCQGNHVRSPLA
jgi:hypothetical protein